MNTLKEKLQLFSATDYAKIIKILVGVFISFILAQIFNFSSVSVSASTVLVILMSSNESSSRSYLKRRMLSQFIGIPVAVVFYYLIYSCSGIPSFLRPAVTVTVAVGAALIINLIFHIVSQWSSLVVAVFIVISFESQNPKYPLLRIEQVFLGILLGYLVHRFVLPVNIFALAHKQFNKVSNQFFDVMERFFIISERCSLDESQVLSVKEGMLGLEQNLVAVQDDLELKSFSRYDKHSEELEIFKSCSVMMQNTIEIFELLQTFQASYDNLRNEFKECFTDDIHALLNLHKIICSIHIEDIFSEISKLHNVTIKTIPLQGREEIILMSRVYEYEITLNQLLGKLKRKAENDLEYQTVY